MWPRHGYEHQIVVTVVEDARTGAIMIPCDLWAKAMPYGPLGGAQSIVQHNDGGWAKVADPGAWHVSKSSAHNRTDDTNTGAHHASIVQLREQGRFEAIGRGFPIDGSMGMATSTDGGYHWAPHKSTFPPIAITPGGKPVGGHREVMIRLGSIDENPLMMCSFALEKMAVPCECPKEAAGASSERLGARLSSIWASKGCAERIRERR